MKVWTESQKARGDKRVAKCLAEVTQRTIRLEKAQAILAEAEKRVARHTSVLIDDQAELDKATENRNLMDRSCHVCGTGFTRNATIFVAFSADGEERVGDRCEPCQAVARKLAPLSATGAGAASFIDTSLPMLPPAE
jgi:hypothetical protein